MKPLPCEKLIAPNLSTSRIDKEVEETTNTHLILLTANTWEKIITRGGTYRWVVVWVSWLGLVMCIVRTHPKPPSVFGIPIITSLGDTKVTAPTTSLFRPFGKIGWPKVSGVLPLPRVLLRIGRRHTYNNFILKLLWTIFQTKISKDFYDKKKTYIECLQQCLKTKIGEQQCIHQVLPSTK
jgi:hypothetical protein